MVEGDCAGADLAAGFETIGKRVKLTSYDLSASSSFESRAKTRAASGLGLTFFSIKVHYAALSAASSCDTLHLLQPADGSLLRCAKRS